MARPKSTKVEKKPKKPQKRACITEGNQVEKDLVFLWMCFECSGGIQEGQSTVIPNSFSFHSSRRSNPSSSEASVDYG